MKGASSQNKFRKGRRNIRRRVSMVYNNQRPKLHKLTPSLISLKISSISVRITEDVYKCFIFLIAENCWERPTVLLRKEDDLRCFRCNKVHKYENEKKNDSETSSSGSTPLSSTDSVGMIYLLFIYYY